MMSSLRQYLFTLLFFLSSFSVFASLQTLKIIENNLKRPDGALFDEYRGCDPSFSIEGWDNIFSGYEIDYNSVFSSHPRRERDLSKGVLVLDLRNTVMFQSSSATCQVPLDLIRKVLRKAERIRLPILIISSHLEHPSQVQRYFIKKLGVSKANFYKNYDIIAASYMVSKSKWQETEESERSSKGDNLLQWMINSRSKERAGPIWAIDDNIFHLKSIIRAFHKARLTRVKTHSFYLKGDLKQRKAIWTALLDSLPQSFPSLDWHSCCFRR